MSKVLRYTLVILALFAFSNVTLSQTKPKTTTQTTKKAPVKKAPIKKAAVKKPAETSAYVCTSNKDKYYHKRSSCGALNKCSETVKFCKTQAELAKWKRQRCSRCYNM